MSDAEPTGTVTTWLDGRCQTVPADDPRLAEREAARVRQVHIANLRRLGSQGRRDYVAAVERREGAAAAQLLRDAYAADWERRKAPK